MTSREELNKTVEVFFQERSAWLSMANNNAEQVRKYLDKVDELSKEYLKTVGSPELLSSLSTEDIDKYADMELAFLETFRDRYKHLHNLYDSLNTFWGHL